MVWAMFGYGSEDEYNAARAEREKQMDEAQAQSDLTNHQVVRVMNELDEEHCTVFYKVLAQVRDAGNVSSLEAVTAAFWIGVLRGRLNAVFGVCMSCGKKHDDEFARLIENQPDKDTPS